MTSPSVLATAPGVIPYVEYHDGPRRLLVIDIPCGGNEARRSAPIASIDGRQYVVSWGTVSFEIPADRNVHVSVYLQSSGGGAHYASTQFASAILPPHPAPARLAARLSSAMEGALVPVEPPRA
ncbi:hypothetical protein ACFWY9_43220 [Amycolatopsis sp. NPDC059027]|uniref:hypothetical protein n=1 Tax=unclassified Amycolatopsis TaxID=2618356 RepID=UPI003671DFB0